MLTSNPPIKASASQESFARIPKSVLTDKELSLGAFRLFASLASRCISKPYCWGRAETLAEDYTTRHLSRLLKELQKRNHITVVRSGRIIRVTLTWLSSGTVPSPVQDISVPEERHFCHSDQDKNVLPIEVEELEGEKEEHHHQESGQERTDDDDDGMLFDNSEKASPDQIEEIDKLKREIWNRGDCPYDLEGFGYALVDTDYEDLTFIQAIVLIGLLRAMPSTPLVPPESQACRSTQEDRPKAPERPQKASQWVPREKRPETQAQRKYIQSLMTKADGLGIDFGAVYRTVNPTLEERNSEQDASDYISALEEAIRRADGHRRQSRGYSHGNPRRN